MEGSKRLVEANLSLEGIETHDHVALFYSTQEEKDRQTAKLILSGCCRGEMSVIIFSPGTEEGIYRAIRDLGGKVDELLGNGCFRIIGMNPENLTPQTHMTFIESLIQDGLARGFPVVRVISDASAIEQHVESAELLRMESLSNEIFEDLNAIGICLWQQDDPNVTEVVATHPSLIVRGFLCRNYFYIAPRDLARDGRALPQGSAFLERLLEIQINEMSLNSKDDTLSDLNRRLAEEVAQRQLVEWALLQSETNYSNALNAMVDMVEVTDREGRVILVNQEFIERVRALGYEGPIIGELLQEVTPFVSPEHEHDLKRIYSNGRPIVREESFEVGRKMVHLEVRKQPVMNGNFVSGVMMIYRDVTERKNAENALARMKSELERLDQWRVEEAYFAQEIAQQERERRFQAEDRLDSLLLVLDLSPLPIFLQNNQGIITYANRAGCAYVGYEVDEVVGRPYIELFVPQHRQLVGDQMKELARNGEINFFADAVRKDGSSLCCSINAVNLNDGAGHLLALMREESEGRLFLGIFEAV